MNTDDIPVSSNFTPLQGEANFAPPITRELVGGAHIAPECVTTQDGQFVMADWPDGLPRHDDGHTVRFPHGLMLYGETIEDCAKRLVSDQLGMKVDNVRVLNIYSYMDDAPHWHIEPLLHVEVSGGDDLPSGVSGLVRHSDRTLPEFAVWGDGEFEKVYDEFFSGGRL